MAKDGTSGVGPKQKPDDLKAVKIIRDALDGFKDDERERIIRWVLESLGLSHGAHTTGVGAEPPKTQTDLPHASTPSAQARAATDIATFVNEKDPQTDIQLATTVAYYYAFEAPAKDRKAEIDATFLRDALRPAGRPGKLKKPLATLNNAHAKGLLDRGSERGTFAINAVGENLVGMTLPGGTAQPARGRRAKGRKKTTKSRG